MHLTDTSCMNQNIEITFFVTEEKILIDYIEQVDIGGKMLPYLVNQNPHEMGGTVRKGCVCCRT